MYVANKITDHIANVINPCQFGFNLRKAACTPIALGIS